MGKKSEAGNFDVIQYIEDRHAQAARFHKLIPLMREEADSLLRDLEKPRAVDRKGELRRYETHQDALHSLERRYVRFMIEHNQIFHGE